MILGFTFLLGANMAELGIPLYIGVVIDMFNKRDFDGVATLSAWMLLCIIVSARVVSYFMWAPRFNIFVLLLLSSQGFASACVQQSSTF